MLAKLDSLRDELWPELVGGDLVQVLELVLIN